MKKLKRALLGFIYLVSVFLLSCQQAPTRVFSTHKKQVSRLVENRKKPLVIDDETVVLDARSSFDYSLLHIPKSLNLDWKEFTDHRGPLPGLLKTDYDFMARRLARLGIQPESKIIVVGYGQKGKGEEGRLAWTLYYLGIENIQVADINFFKKRMRQETTRPPKPATIWQPKKNDFVRVGKAEFLKLLSESKKKSLRVLDVRTPREYLKKSSGRGLPEMNAINVFWKEFMNRDGRPNYETAGKLQAIGVKRSDPIVVLSNNGVRSATVTMALLALGFENVMNYDGGWKELSRW